MALSLALAAQAGLAQTPTAEERLAAIRHSLLQVALDGPTQVQTTSWIDAQGALRESSTFRTGMQVRGIRVLGYTTDAQGQARAEVQIQNTERLAPRAGAPDASTNNCTGAERKGHLQHLVALQWKALPQWSADDMPLLEATRELLNAEWQRAASASNAWRLAEVGDAARSAYQQALLGSGTDRIAWRLTLALEAMPQDVSDPLPRPPLGYNDDWQQILRAPVPKQLPVRLQATLSERGQTQAVLQESLLLNLQAERSNWGSAALDQASHTRITEQVATLTQSLLQKMRCQPLVASVRRHTDADIRINAGSSAGVRVGDEWLLADARQFPQQLLEPGMAGKTVLAKVRSVDTHQAQLQLLAGPAQAVQSTWHAWSTQ
ncbi:MAG: hypothetical protein ACR2I0_07125 [Rhodoferax sp.]